MLGVQGGQRRMMDPPELELQMVECCGIEYLLNHVKMSCICLCYKIFVYVKICCTCLCCICLIMKRCVAAFV